MVNQETVLITGGAGFIGSHLCERLLTEGCRVICLDNFDNFYDPALKEENIAEACKHPQFTLIRGDILDTGLLEKIFTSKPNMIIHFAAIAGVRPSIADPARYVDVDIKGTVNLLHMAKACEAEQFIFASSSSVYGIRSTIPFLEGDRIDCPASPYAVAKMAGELYCKTYHHLYGIPITILRFFNVYGPRQRPDTAIHKFTRLMSQGKPISMHGDGSSARDYTYIDDCIHGVMAAIEKPSEFEIFNLGNSAMVKLKDLIGLLAGKLEVHPEIEQLPEQTGDVPISCADIAKARRMLGYHPSTSINEGIEKFIEWFLGSSSR